MCALCVPPFLGYYQIFIDQLLSTAQFADSIDSTFCWFWIILNLFHIRSTTVALYNIWIIYVTVEVAFLKCCFKSCCWKFCKIGDKTAMLESSFKNIGTLHCATLLKTPPLGGYFCNSKFRRNGMIVSALYFSMLLLWRSDE